MSRTTIANLESQLSSITHELELATFLNKGILQTNTEYKLRVAELESENAMLQKAETRLSKTEDRLEEAERRLRTFVVEREDWEVEKQRESAEKDKLAQERDAWEKKYWALRIRIQDALSADDSQEEEGMATRPPPKTQQRQLASLVNPDHRANRNGSAGGSGNSYYKKDDIRTPQQAAETKSRLISSSRRQSLSRQQPQPQLQPVASSSKISLSPIIQPSRAQSKKRRRVQDSSSGDDEDQDGHQAGVEKAEGEPDDAEKEGTRSRSHLFYRRARDHRMILDGADDHLNFDLEDDDDEVFGGIVEVGDGDLEGRLQSDPLVGSQLYSQTPPKDLSPSRRINRIPKTSSSASVAGTGQKSKRRSQVATTTVATMSTPTPNTKANITANNNKSSEKNHTSSTIKPLKIKSDPTTGHVQTQFVSGVKDEPISVSPEDPTKSRGGRAVDAKKPRRQYQRKSGNGPVTKFWSNTGAGDTHQGGGSGSESEDDPLAMV
ncbi:hypothetical protein I317_07896 [Kwoniella heveanensis CBS 569]|nr:hypothetical protein I317_07896 [Kwoniella heveanensis CBS 569]